MKYEEDFEDEPKPDFDEPKPEWEEDEEDDYRGFWEGVWEEWLKDQIWEHKYDIILHEKTKKMYERD